MTSKLVIHSDAEFLRTLAKETAKEFNPADVFWLVPKEGASTIQVAETLEMVDMAHLAPIGDKKLFIILDAATVTIAAQNKLLKTLEDAPASSTFLLLATSINPILNTIRSRCVTVYSKQESKDEPLVPSEVIATVKKLFKSVDVATYEGKGEGLSAEQRYGIMKVQAEINKRLAANCNAQNQQDLLILEIIKYAKNS